VAGCCGGAGERMLIVSTTPSEPQRGFTHGFRPQISIMEMGDTDGVRVRVRGAYLDAGALPEPSRTSSNCSDYAVSCGRPHGDGRCRHCLVGWSVDEDDACDVEPHDMRVCVCGATCEMPLVGCGCCGVGAVYAVLDKQLHHPHLALGLQLLLHGGALQGHSVPHAPMMYRSLNLEPPPTMRVGVRCDCGQDGCARCAADLAALRCLDRVRKETLPWNRK